MAIGGGKKTGKKKAVKAKLPKIVAAPGEPMKDPGGILTNSAPHSVHILDYLPGGEVRLIFLCPGGSHYFPVLANLKITPMYKDAKTFKISKMTPLPL